MCPGLPASATLWVSARSGRSNERACSDPAVRVGAGRVRTVAKARAIGHESSFHANLSTETSRSLAAWCRRRCSAAARRSSSGLRQRGGRRAGRVIVPRSEGGSHVVCSPLPPATARCGCRRERPSPRVRLDLGRPLRARSASSRAVPLDPALARLETVPPPQEVQPSSATVAGRFFQAGEAPSG